MFDDFGDIESEESFGSYAPEEPEGLLPPRKSTIMRGHEGNEQKLIDLIESGAMPHAIIFSGPMGIGKSTMAFRLARYLLKNGTPDMAQDSLFGDAPMKIESLSIPQSDPVFSQVVSGGHPDLLTLERPIDTKKGTVKDNMDVETARKVAPFLRMTASNGGWRVVIIDDADSMNRNAQNALLKILEEPPKNALLILITHRLGAMIPTIRSRCRVLNFEPLSTEVLSELMQKQVGQTLPDDQFEILKSMSQGSIGVAQDIIDSDGIEMAQKLLDILEPWPNLKGVDIHHLSDQAGRAGQDRGFEMIEKTFLWICENFVFSKANSQHNLPLPLKKTGLMQLMEAKSLEEWLTLYEALKAHFYQAKNSNLDKRQAVLVAFNFLQN